MPNFETCSSYDKMNALQAYYSGKYDQCVDSKKFKSKDRIVNKNGNYIQEEYQGSHYRLISKKEYSRSTRNRIFRCFLGVVACIASLGIAIIFKSIQNLFKNEKIVVRYGVLVTDELQIFNLIKKPMYDSVLTELKKRTNKFVDHQQYLKNVLPNLEIENQQANLTTLIQTGEFELFKDVWQNVLPEAKNTGARFSSWIDLCLRNALVYSKIPLYSIEYLNLNKFIIFLIYENIAVQTLDQKNSLTPLTIAKLIGNQIDPDLLKIIEQKDGGFTEDIEKCLLFRRRFSLEMNLDCDECDLQKSANETIPIIKKYPEHFNLDEILPNAILTSLKKGYSLPIIAILKHKPSLKDWSHPESKKTLYELSEDPKFEKLKTYLSSMESAKADG